MKQKAVLGPSTAVQPALLVRADIVQKQQSIHPSRVSEPEQLRSDYPPNNQRRPPSRREVAASHSAYTPITSLVFFAVLQTPSAYAISLRIAYVHLQYPHW